ncbi:MAG: hypothetical protein J0L51_02530 [Rhizobiales bacterium]|nr:hypothetical protein [Hyphomicrobiales bacterium]
MHSNLPNRVTQPAGFAGFANDNSAPGYGSAPKGMAGLALSCETDASGHPIAAIRPVMVDGTLGQSLHVAEDGTDIIAIWRAFGQSMNLPLFAVASDGSLEVFAMPMSGVAYPRRGGSPLSNRRTRFARKRQIPLRTFEKTAGRVVTRR